MRNKATVSGAGGDVVPEHPRQLLCGNNFMTQRLPFVLTLAGLLWATSLNGAERTKASWPPRLLLNSDCGTPVFYKFDAPMGEDQLCHVLIDLPGTKIDDILTCTHISDDQM